MNIKDVNPEHNLYILKVYGKEGSLIKLGYSSKIKDRLYSYYQSNPLVEILGTYYREDALEFEKQLHRTILSVKMNEWYKEEDYELILSFINKGIPENLISDKIKKINYKEEIDKKCIELYSKTWKDTNYAYKMISNYPIWLECIPQISKLFKVGTRYTRKEVKAQIQEIYNTYGVIRKATHTDLSEAYYYKEVRTSTERLIEITGKNFKTI